MNNFNIKYNFSLCFVVLTFFVSCKSDNLQEVLKSSKTPELDLVYYKVVMSEFEELGNSIGIVDKTIDTTSTKLNGITPNYYKSEKTIYWKKEIFPGIDYINGDSLEFSIKRNTEKYWTLRDKFKSGWIELTSPYFTNDRKIVLIEVRFFHGKANGVHSYYMLEWTGKEYEIIEKGLISIS
ncbi:MAG: hypothetical protein K9H61_09210 [Bacteroidia bacterium]|nr:hypothetical protein [Bacteroidia bacterium]MCF8427528.1 hypothetical protein [Bacteroidia bacterium]MCF8447159.1 hypothetical protein [Bacteroidia bacterium]